MTRACQGLALHAIFALLLAMLPARGGGSPVAARDCNLLLLLAPRGGDGAGGGRILRLSGGGGRWGSKPKHKPKHADVAGEREVAGWDGWMNE